MMWKIFTLSFTAAALAAPAMAQPPVRSERVQFSHGASSTTVRGTIRGYDSVDYAVGTRSGQTMTVSLRTTSRSAYFNIVPPRGEEAIFNGSIKGSRFEGRLRDNGDYRIRVYLMRNAARRGETASFTLNVGVSGRPEFGGPGSSPGSSPIGSGVPILVDNRAAFCRGEASAHYGVRPAYITVGRAVPDRGGSVIDGSADQGNKGTKRFRCRFDTRNRFIDVIAISRDGL